MPLDAPTQALVDAANCEFCKIPQGMAYYAVLAELINLNNGATMPTDSDTLIAQAGCLYSCIPAGLVPVVLLQAVRGITTGGGGAAGSTNGGGVVNPEGVVTAVQYSRYYNSANQTDWVKQSGSGNTGWVQTI